MSVTVDLQEFQKNAIADFRESINGHEQVPEKAINIYEKWLREAFNREVTAKDIGRCVTVAFLQTEQDSSGAMVAVPALNRLRSDIRKSMNHKEVARVVCEQAQVPYTIHWPGISWREKDRLAVLVLCPTKKDTLNPYVEAFHAMAESTSSVADYYCMARQVPAELPALATNVTWGNEPK